MAIRKYTTAEKVEVFRGKRAEILNQYFKKTGRYSVSEMTQEEREELDKQLSEVPDGE